MRTIEFPIIATADQQIIENKDNSVAWPSLEQIKNIDIFRNFGYFGSVILAIIAFWLLRKYFDCRRLGRFKKSAKSSLNDLFRETPAELNSALSRAKLGFFLGIVAACSFVFLWHGKEYLAALLLTAFLIFIIDYFVLQKSKNALKFIYLIDSKDKFYDSDSILLNAGIIESRSGLSGKLKGLIESKKDKEKRELKRDKGEKLLLAILACSEAMGKIQVFKLGFSNYFCKTGYIDSFCKEVISQIVGDGKNNPVSGLRIKKLVKTITESSCLDRSAAYDLIIGYFKYGKTFVNNGEFVFYLEDQFDDIDQCDFCGQVIVDLYETPSSNLLFCSENCNKHYRRLFNEDFELNPDFSNKLIDRGVDGLTVVRRMSR